jgi:hypothetical protein
VDEGVGDGVLMHGQEKDMRNHFGHKGGDEKHDGAGGGSSPSVAGGAHLIQRGQWKRRPMMVKPGAKQPQGLKD